MLHSPSPSPVRELPLGKEPLGLHKEQQSRQGAGEWISKHYLHPCHLPHCHLALITLHIYSRQLWLIMVNLYMCVDIVQVEISSGGL